MSEKINNLYDTGNKRGTRQPFFLEGNSRVLYVSCQYNRSQRGTSVPREKKGYHVKIDTPLPFYSDLHRPLHFQNFNELEDLWVDRSDNFE